MTKKIKDAETKEIPGTVVKQTNRMFLVMKEIGMLDARGRKALGLGFSGRMEAKPDRPLVLALAVLNEVIRLARYSSDEAKNRDVENFLKTIDAWFGRKATEPAR